MIGRIWRSANQDLPRHQFVLLALWGAGGSCPTPRFGRSSLSAREERSAPNGATWPVARWLELAAALAPAAWPGAWRLELAAARALDDRPRATPEPRCASVRGPSDTDPNRPPARCRACDARSPCRPRPRGAPGTRDPGPGPRGKQRIFDRPGRITGLATNCAHMAPGAGRVSTSSHENDAPQKGITTMVRPESHSWRSDDWVCANETEATVRSSSTQPKACGPIR